MQETTIRPFNLEDVPELVRVFRRSIAALGPRDFALGDVMIHNYAMELDLATMAEKPPDLHTP